MWWMIEKVWVDERDWEKVVHPSVLRTAPLKKGSSLLKFNVVGN
jgi:hypothetical protein